MLRTNDDGQKPYLAFGLILGVGAACAGLVAWGNPGNMGLCGACFLRDMSGALGMFSGNGPKIFRPEVIGLMLGALAWVVAKRKFEARSGSFAATRFFFGMWMAIGALVFLGCPFRMLQRIGGGDAHAMLGLLGFIPGVGIGLWFEKKGYNVGKTSVVATPVGLLPHLFVLLALGLFLLGGRLNGPGPGEIGSPAHAPWFGALGIAGMAGVILSATGFCAITAARQVFLKKKTMLIAAACMISGYAIVSLLSGKFHWGFEGQPTAHGDILWSIIALALVGFTGVITGGCPVRQIVMSGEGNGDAFMTVMGLLVGGALAHNLELASSGVGTTPSGRMAIIIGLALCLAYATWIIKPSKA